MKLTIKKIFRNEKISKKTNQPYVSIGLITQEYGDNQYINGFGNQQNVNWKEGDIIDVEVKESEWNGNKVLNFNMPIQNNMPPQDNIPQQNIPQGNNEVMDILKIILQEIKELKNKIK